MVLVLVSVCSLVSVLVLLVVGGRLFKFGVVLVLVSVFRMFVGIVLIVRLLSEFILIMVSMVVMVWLFRLMCWFVNVEWLDMVNF